MRKSVFALCDDHNAYIGYTSGALWNGWATPYFTLEEAQRLQADFNKGVDNPMLYDVAKDEFRIQYDGDDEPYIWEGEDIQTVDGIKHLYGIGAYSHIWDELGDGFKRHLAQGVADFMLEYDTYNYNDDDETREDMVADVLVQLANLTTFVKVYGIMYDESLSALGIYSKLEEALTL